MPDFFDLKSENNVSLGVKIFHENIRGRNVCGLSKWIVITMCDRNRGMVEKRKTNGQKSCHLTQKIRCSKKVFIASRDGSSAFIVILTFVVIEY